LSSQPLQLLLDDFAQVALRAGVDDDFVHCRYCTMPPTIVGKRGNA
jgi:hypothetical protein